MCSFPNVCIAVILCREYARRAFISVFTREDRDEMQRLLQEKFQPLRERGQLDNIDWNNEPLPHLPSSAVPAVAPQDQ